MKNNYIILLTLFLITLCTSKNDTFTFRLGILQGEKGHYSIKKETDKITLIIRSKRFLYGLEISPPNNKQYHFYATAYFPDKPKKLSGAIENIPLDSNFNKVTTPAYDLKGKRIFPMGFDEGDPLGKYKIDLYINNELYKTIEYEVISPNKKNNV